MADKEYISKVRNEINKWEEESPGFLSSISDLILYPAQKAAELMIPDSVLKTISKATEGCLNALLWGADYTFSDEGVLTTVRERNNSLINLKAVYDSDDLESMDLAADSYWNQNLVAAIVQGGVTGAVGLLGLAANLPALYTVVFRCIQQIALCYGFDTSKDEEKVFILGVLSIASTSDVASKQAAMVFMRQIQVDIAKKTWKKLAEEGGRAAIGPLVKQAAKTIGVNITKRKALMLIPAIGALVGASFDAMYLQDIARAAKNCYRKRKIEKMDFSIKDLDSGQPRIFDFIS